MPSFPFTFPGTFPAGGSNSGGITPNINPSVTPADTPLQPMPFKAIEDAIVAWIRRSVGNYLPRGLDRVTNAKRRNIQPAQPYIEYTVPMPRPEGGEPDEVRFSYDSNNSLGQEVVKSYRGRRELIITIQAFTNAAGGDADVSGYLTAKHYIEMCIAALAYESITDKLYDGAGLVFISVENVADLSAALGPIGQGRALADIRFRTVHTNYDYEGYIATFSKPVLGIVANPGVGLSATTSLSGKKI